MPTRRTLCVILIGLAAAAVVPAVGGNTAGGAGAAGLRDMYLAYLRDRGIPAKIDADGDIEFTHQYQTLDLPFHIIVDLDDPNVFTLYADGLWSVSGDAIKSQALRAASVASREAKVAKMCLNSDDSNVRIYAEALIYDPQDFTEIFDRLLAEMDKALDTFLEVMTGGVS